MNDEHAPLYTPCFPWSSYDFEINRIYWESIGVEHAYDIRMRNLRDLSSVLGEFEVPHWLFGKTLWSAVKTGTLMDDHDDDIGLFSSSREVVMSEVRRRLEGLGFELIRDTDGIVSFVRDGRYVDLCLFRSKGMEKVGYNNKLISRRFLAILEEVQLDGVRFPVPAESSALIESVYPSSTLRRLLMRFYPFELFISLMRNLKRLPGRVKSKHVSILENGDFTGVGLFETFAPLSGFSVRNLSLEEFRALYVEPQDSFNWRWRYRHLSMVTDDGDLALIRDVVEHLSCPQTRKSIDSSVEESDTSKEFHHRSNLDMRFWWSGNNYFWYCVKYGFRKGVLPYSEANTYIKEGLRPLLYTAEYYESLPVMSDKEIESLLANHPIVIEDGCVTSGKHRVFAMIGRLSKGKPYIPFKGIEL